MVVKFPCGICNKQVNNNHKALCCDICQKWIHIKCNFITKTEYEKFKDDSQSWYCLKCLKDIIPFAGINNDSLFKTFQGIAETNLDFECINESYQSAFAISSNDDTEIEINHEVIPYIHPTDIRKCKIGEKSLGVLHLNISSISSHIDDLKILLSLIKNKIDIICLSESRIKKGILPTTNIEIQGYSIEHTPTEANAGGVMMYISKDLKYKLRTDLSMYNPKELESLFIELLLPKQKHLILGCVYRHPNMNANDFNRNFLPNILTKTQRERKNFMLTGDFNFNLLNNHNHSETSEFIEQMFSHNLIPRILHPTRISQRSSTLIDNIFYNSEERPLISGNITASLSDHLPQFIFIKDFFSKAKELNHTIYKRDFSNFDAQHFVTEIEAMSWENIYNSNSEDLNKNFENLIHRVTETVNVFAPIKKLSKKCTSFIEKPWITRTVQKAIKNRDKIHMAFIKEKDINKKDNIWESYKRIRNQTTELLRKSKNDYYLNFFEKNKHNCKRTWEGINKIMHPRRSKNLSFPSSLEVNGKTTFNKNEISNHFNDFFVNVGISTQNNIRNTHKIPSDYLNSETSETFFIQPTFPKEIEDIISSLDTSKGVGPNSIPSCIFKLIKEPISHPLSHLINLSFQNGIFPDLLKIAKVIPVFKGKSKLDCSNYRPISILSNLSKVLEKLMHKRLYKFIDTNKDFYQHQFGFRLKKSTNDAMICILDNLQKELDNGKFSCGIFIDLKKAFDTVDHKILLGKLEHYGIRGVGLNWFKSYLSDRKQFVSIDNTNSETKLISCGVPQGSILGPLLFLVYINDLNKAILSSKVFHFADDTSLILSDLSYKKLVKLMNQDLRLLNEWLRANKLCLNVLKSELLIFNPLNKNGDSSYKIKLDGKILIPTNNVKYLGILVDNKLNWSYQISSLSKRLSRAIGILSKLRYNMPKNALRMVYHSIFNSLLLYGCQIWGINSKINNTKIQNLQDRAIRKITFSKSNCDIDQLYKDLKLLKFKDMLFVQNCILMSRVVNDLLPQSFKSNFCQRSDIHHHRTRAATLNQLDIPTVLTQRFGTLSTTYRCISDWNEFIKLYPQINIKDLTPNQIRQALLKHFLADY